MATAKSSVFNLESLKDALNQPCFSVQETTIEEISDLLEGGNLEVVAEHDFGFLSIHEVANEGTSFLYITSSMDDRVIKIAK